VFEGVLLTVASVYAVLMFIPRVTLPFSSGVGVVVPPIAPQTAVTNSCCPCPVGSVGRNQYVSCPKTATILSAVRVATGNEIAGTKTDAATILDFNSKCYMLTHVIFHPIQKSLNRIIEVVYTIRIQMQ
jgi:hypothetical protein